MISLIKTMIPGLGRTVRSWSNLPRSVDVNGAVSIRRLPQRIFSGITWLCGAHVSTGICSVAELPSDQQWLVVFGHPSEKWWSESQLGSWNSEYDGKNKKCSKPPTRTVLVFAYPAKKICRSESQDPQSLPPFHPFHPLSPLMGLWWWCNCSQLGYPLVICYITMENHHRNREFSPEKWWLSIVM